MRIKTGIPGLDELLGGGLLSGSSALLRGPIGTVKVFMGIQFIYEGLRSNEPCTYVSTSQDLGSIQDVAKSNFGWDFHGKNLSFIDLFGDKTLDIESYLDPKSVVDQILAKSRSGGRLLIHNLSHMTNFLKEERMISKIVSVLNLRLRKEGVTTMYILDQDAQPKWLEVNLASLCDNVLVMGGSRCGIKVLRAFSRHSVEWHDISFTDQGIKVHLTS